MQFTPLRTSFLAAGLVGFLISAIWFGGTFWNLTKTDPKTGEVSYPIRPWIVSFSLLFFLMIIASLWSMAKAPPEPQIKRGRRK